MIILAISRDEAIQLICKKNIRQLSKLDREEILLDWWCINENDSEFFRLNTELQNKLKSTSEPNEPENEEYDELIIIALADKFYGVRNEYLEKKLVKYYSNNYIVNGRPEKMQPCPCCNFLTLKKRREYDICPICMWEDTGDELDLYSGPNHMTLREGKMFFKNSTNYFPKDKFPSSMD